MWHAKIRAFHINQIDQIKIELGIEWKTVQ